MIRVRRGLSGHCEEQCCGSEGDAADETRALWCVGARAGGAVSCCSSSSAGSIFIVI